MSDRKPVSYYQSADSMSVNSHGIILLILSSHFAVLCVACRLDEDTVLARLTSDDLLQDIEARRLGDMAIGSRPSRVETIAIEKGDVGLGSVALVVGVADHSNLLEAHGADDGLLSSKEGLHGEIRQRGDEG